MNRKGALPLYESDWNVFYLFKEAIIPFTLPMSWGFQKGVDGLLSMMR